MKRTITFAAVALLLSPALSLAASIQLSPTQIAATVGQTFTLQVVPTPSGSPIYTASANVSFNPNLLEVTGFSLAPTWIAVSQNGYDLIDNTNGLLIKTGGYPNGFTNPTVLGTITFRAKASGNATITATGNSVLLDGGSNNQLSGPQGSVSVAIAQAPTTQNTTVTVPTPNNSGPLPGTTPTSNASAGTAGQTAGAAGAIATSSQTASAASSFAGIPDWLWWLILAIIVIGGGYWLWRQYGNKS